MRICRFFKLRYFSALSSVFVSSTCFFLVPASAHQLHEVVQSAYITLAPDVIRLELDVNPGQEVSNSVLKSLDANGDQRISTSEANAFANQVLTQSRLVLDGAPKSWNLQDVRISPYQTFYSSTGMIKIFALASRVEKQSTHSFSYQNNYAPASSQLSANVFLEPNDLWSYKLRSQKHSKDGSGLKVTYQSSKSSSNQPSSNQSSSKL